MKTNNLLSRTGKSDLKFAPTMSGKSKNSKVFSLLFIAALTFLTTINAFAVCQTPQFALPVALTVSRPVAVAPGDYNSDGTVDLAILRNIPGGTFPGTVEMFLGNGNGGFASTGIQYNATQSTANDLAAADFNNDGKLDLAASGYFASGTLRGVAILLGNGSGGFGSPSNYINVAFPTSITTGDFNNDGNADIIAKNGVSSSRFASILPGLGNGNFGGAIDVPTDGYSYTVAVRDLNNDGFLDFVTVNDNNPDTVSVRLGNGSFIFTNSPPIAADGAVDATINDFNRDGKQDFLVARRGSGSGSVGVFLGVGDGTFNTPIGSPFAIPNNSQSIASADFNSDNIPDAAIGNTSATNSLSILLNNGAGGFGSPFNLSPEQGASEKVYSLDFNRNGATDLVIVKEIAQNKVVLLRNICSPPNKPPFDFDGDGRSDVSVFRPSNGAWYLNQSQNGFTGIAFGTGTDKLVPADYDGDRRTDVAVYRAGIWYLQRSQAGFTGVTFGDADDIPQPADFDGDGRAELAVFRPSNGVWYVLNLANNQFNAVQFGASADKPVAADYDGDGKADYAVYRAGTWYLLRSGLGFTGIGFGDTNDRPVPGDYDGDGKTDIAVFRPSNGTWYLLQSAAGFTGIAFGLGTDSPTPADYDGDGKTDVAVFRDGTWYVQRSMQGFTGVAFGTATDRPVPNAFVP